MSGGVRAKHLVLITLKVKGKGEGSWDPRRVFGHLEPGRTLRTGSSDKIPTLY